MIEGLRARLLVVGEAIRTLMHPEGMDERAFRRAFEDEAQDSNARVVLWATCVLVPLRVLAVITVLRHVETEPERTTWLAGVVGIQVVEAVILLLAGVVAWRGRPGALWRVLGDVVTTTALLTAAAMSANAQRAYPNLNVFIIAAVCIALFLRARPRVFVTALLVSTAIVAAGVAYFPRDPAARTAEAFSLLAVTLMALFGFFMSRSMRARELILRRRVEQINADLEGRVAAQVGEILGHAKEIEGLNAQLNEKIRERSRELSAALARLAEGHRALEAGTVLGGRVELQARIGQGAMGVVYRGRDLVTDKTVAVKVLHASSANELDGLHRFLREAEALASVKHPAIVRTVHVDVGDDGRLFQVMELVEGETLDARLRRAGPLPVGVASRLGSVLAEALAAAHAAGVVHRDVKPSNVMLTKAAPGLKLLDFGISKLRDTSDVGGLTEGRILGTPEFLSPEQINAPRRVAAPADVYALGLVLYLCLAGRMPFDPGSTKSWLLMHLAQPPAELSHSVPDLDPALASAVMACLEKDPEGRPTASAMAATLTRLADEARTPPLEALDLVRSERELSSAATLTLPDETAARLTRETLPSNPRT